MVETITVPDMSRVGKKGTPRYYEAYGVEPPMIEIPIGNVEVVGPQENPVPQKISRRQFFQYLAIIKVITEQEALDAISSKAIPSILDGMIGSLPEKEQFSARALVLGANEFDIQNPLAEVIRVMMNWSIEEKFNFWRKAYKI